MSQNPLLCHLSSCTSHFIALKSLTGRKFSKYKSFSLLTFYFITTGKMIAWRSKSSPFVLEIKFKSIWSYSHCTVADGTSRQSGSTVQIQNGLEARSVPLWWGAWARDLENSIELRKMLVLQAAVSYYQAKCHGLTFPCLCDVTYSVKSISGVFCCQPTQPAFAYASSFLNIMF